MRKEKTRTEKQRKRDAASGRGEKCTSQTAGTGEMCRRYKEKRVWKSYVDLRATQ